MPDGPSVRLALVQLADAAQIQSRHQIAAVCRRAVARLDDLDAAVQRAHVARLRGGQRVADKITWARDFLARYGQAA